MKQIIYFSVLATMLSCASNKNSMNNENNRKPIIEESIEMNKPVLKVEKTPCFGTCPIYTFELYKDKIVYNGIDFVAKKGIETINITESDFEQVPFESYKEEYEVNITDIPYLLVTYKGKTVRAADIRDAEPKELFDYVADLETNFELVDYLK